MSNIGIVTFNQAINFGAVLQMYALQNCIKQLGGSCEIVNYQSKKLAKIYERKKLKYYLNPKKLYSFIFRNSCTSYNTEGFRAFIDKHISVSSQVYHTPESLKEANRNYEIFIAGSDQVFNIYCCAGDDSYFLPFVTSPNIKYSYAASLGLSRIPPELVGQYQELLCDFKELSIREKTGASAISQVLNKSCRVDVDPSFLLSKEDWTEVASPCLTPDKYILVYVLAEDKHIFAHAKKLAKKHKCKIIYINDRFFSRFGMDNKRKTEPSEWLDLFRNASAVVTNSYHGLVFSLIFDRTVYPFLLRINSRVNSRIVDLLDEYKMSHILDESYRNDAQINVSQMTSTARDLLENNISKSKQYLEQIIAESVTLCKKKKD